MEMDPDADLSVALVRLANAGRMDFLDQRRDALVRRAMRRATPYADAWPGRAILFLLRSFFAQDPQGALDLYGGLEAARPVLGGEGREALFLRGWGALLRGERELVVPAFEGAIAADPAEDAFVLFSAAYALARTDAAAAALGKMVARLERAFPAHPLTPVARGLVG